MSMADVSERKMGKPLQRRLALGLTLVGGLARLIPHPANFSPLGSMSLFAGSRIRGPWAYLVPLIILMISDPLLALLYGYPVIRPMTPFIYAAFLINVFIGRKLLRKPSASRVGVAVLLGSTQFFLLTNLAVWLVEGWYPLTASGLAACYLMALPYYGRTLAGNLIYAGILFSLHALLPRLLSPAAQPIEQQAAAAR